VVERYQEGRTFTGFIKGFGLGKGAIASSISHDSHNIVVVGVKDEDIASAVNEIISMGGGLAYVEGNRKKVLPLPIAGLMSYEKGEKVASLHRELKASVESTLSEPFGTLSFMCLLVIPKLKIFDKGLFDAEKFEQVNLIMEE